jgi:hypothetical protein
LDAIPASRVSARIGALIARHHGGDRLAAASQLGLEPEHLEGLLSGDWRKFSLDGLAALVLGYRIPIESLLTSTATAEELRR